MVDKWTRLSREAAGPSQPVWLVLQAHDLTYRNFKQAVKELGPPIRPSCQETRCMAFLALANGATGLIWYWSPNRMYHLRNDAPKVWKGLCDVVHELNGLMPYLVARRTADPPEVPEPFRTWSRRSGGQRVLAIVNSSAKPATLHLDLGHWRVSTLRLRRTGKAVALLDGKLTAAFEPHEVRVYEWQTRR